MKKKFIILIVGIALFVLLFNVGLGSFLQSRTSDKPQVTVTPTQVQQKKTEAFSYRGVEGQDALTLLKAKTSVEQNNSGLVIAISGRKADDKIHEFWAFYVNGKMASVGPAEYQTRNTDLIEWKIEKY